MSCPEPNTIKNISREELFQSLICPDFVQKWKVYPKNPDFSNPHQILIILTHWQFYFIYPCQK